MALEALPQPVSRIVALSLAILALALAALLAVAPFVRMAAAELQRVISELARQNALSLRSTQVAPAKREADLTVLAVEVSLQGGIEGLRTFVHSLETGAPVLFIDALSIKSVAQPTANRPALLDVSLKVRGYGAGKDAN